LVWLIWTVARVTKTKFKFTWLRLEVSCRRVYCIKAEWHVVNVVLFAQRLVLVIVVTFSKQIKDIRLITTQLRIHLVLSCLIVSIHLLIGNLILVLVVTCVKIIVWVCMILILKFFHVWNPKILSSTALILVGVNTLKILIFIEILGIGIIYRTTFHIIILIEILILLKIIFVI